MRRKTTKTKEMVDPKALFTFIDQGLFLHCALKGLLKLAVLTVYLNIWREGQGCLSPFNLYHVIRITAPSGFCPFTHASVTTAFHTPFISPTSFLSRARICKPYRFPAWRAGTITLIDVPAARLNKLAESIPWNRFLGSLNVYKYRLRLSPDFLRHLSFHRTSIL
jgi:hypothetical protein